MIKYVLAAAHTHESHTIRQNGWNYRFELIRGYILHAIFNTCVDSHFNARFHSRKSYFDAIFPLECNTICANKCDCHQQNRTIYPSIGISTCKSRLNKIKVTPYLAKYYQLDNNHIGSISLFDTTMAFVHTICDFFCSIFYLLNQFLPYWTWYNTLRLEYIA